MRKRAGRGTLAIIPARGGSKGIPRKNLADLGDMPLIAYSIKSALACGGIDRVVASTDDTEIADAARQYGAEVPCLRPGAMARDDSSIAEAITHTLQNLKGYYPFAVVTLLPTQPFRSARLMARLLANLQDGWGQIKTVTPITVHDRSHFLIDDQNQARSLWEPFFARGGAETATLYRFNGLFHGWVPSRNQERVLLHPVTDPVELIDIDQPADLALARRVVEKRLYDFGW